MPATLMLFVRRVAALGLVALVGAVQLIASTNAFAVDDLRISATPGRLVLAGKAPGPRGGVLTFTVKSSVPADLSLRMHDVITDQSGMAVNVEPGSTQYGLASAITLAPGDTIPIAASSEPQTVRVQVTLDPGATDRPRIGILSAALTPRGEAEGQGVTVKAGVGIDTVVVWQVDSGPWSTNPRLEPAGLSFERTKVGPTPLDSLVPGFIPGLLNSGPVSVSSRVRNTGDLILAVNTSVTFASVGPFALFGSDEGGQVFKRVNLPEHSALPQQIALDRTSSDITASDGSTGKDSLPLLGVVKVTSTTTGKLGPLASNTVTQSAVFVVAPWKEGLVVLLAIGLLIWFRLWRRKRAVSSMRRVAGKGSTTAADAAGATTASTATDAPADTEPNEPHKGGLDSLSDDNADNAVAPEADSTEDPSDTSTPETDTPPSKD